MVKHRRKILVLTIAIAVIFTLFLSAQSTLRHRISGRRYVIAALYDAIQNRQFQQAAFLNSILGQEAFGRAHRALKAWEKVRDPETGLVPRGTDSRMAYWNAKDTAADLFPFLLLASRYFDEDHEDIWLKALIEERELSGPLPADKIVFHPARILEEGSVFGCSEYAKDGLLTITERLGKGPWSVRLEEIAHVLIDNAGIQTKAGKICSDSAEINGNILQILSRLYWMTERSEYLEMAERTTEAYLFEIFPKSRYLPVLYWDFSKEKPKNIKFRIQAHGGEIIDGLTELYFLEKVKGRPQATHYRERIKKFLDRLLLVGRTKEGLWHRIVDTNTDNVLDKRFVTTWGYILNAYQMFDIAEGHPIYAEEIKRTMTAVTRHRSLGRYPGEYADSIESMLYLLPWFDIPECHRWVDNEIGAMFNKQSSSGFIEEYYLDGQFIRTALLYAAYKTQGITPQPWRKDVRLGAAYDKENKELYIYLSADNSWKGLLKFDPPRHRIIWHLPYNYPRLNAAPEWFVAEPQKSYAVVSINTGDISSYSGQSLAEGLEITLGKESPSVYLKVSEK